MKRLEIKQGNVFGRWAVLSADEYVFGGSGHKKRALKVQCACGNVKIVSLQVIVSGRSKSCGCLTTDKASNSYANKLKYNKQYRNKNKGELNTWLTKTYSRIKRDNKRKFNKGLNFTKDDLKQWALYRGVLQMLEVYKSSGFDKYLNPSVNRLNDYVGYNFDNIELITWRENDIKGHLSDKTKRQCASMAKRKWSKPVIQYSLNGDFINKFESTHDVYRTLGIDPSLIARACRRNVPTKGFKWNYQQTQ